MRTFGVILIAVFAASALNAGPSEPPDRAAKIPASQVIKLDEAINVVLKSKPVDWHGHNYHLAEFGTLTFHRNGDHFKATLKGSILTFDDVTYRISIALYDDTEELLGAGTADCEVPRIWAGYCIAMPRTIEFDFGVSKSFERASIFQLAIAERTVLTPDQWQKE